MKKLLFVVTEVAPLDKGGIGTFSRNMIRKFSMEFSISFLYCGKASRDALEKEYPKIKFFFPACEGQVLMGKTSPEISEMLAEEVDRIFQKETFDYVEFMDWGGWAHQTIMLKCCGKSNIPHSTAIAVRIHSTEHVLGKYEHRLISLRDGETADFEQASLLLADVIICHVEPIARLIASEIKALFGKDISEKIMVTPIPVYLNDKERDRSIIATRQTNIVFSSKTQQIKRPDLFILGVSAFLARNKTHMGKVVFAAHINEDVYTKATFALIPKAFKNNFIRDRKFTQKERESVIASGITVFPAEYESFCFAAYEASMSGSIVVLNTHNPAFGDGSPWIDSVNCIKFDGTSGGLCSALERALALGKPLRSVRANLPDAQILIPIAPPKSNIPPSVDILIYVYDLKSMGRTMNSIMLNAFAPETKIHLFLANEIGQALKAGHEMLGGTNGKFTVLPPGANPIEALRICAQECTSDFILFLASGNELSPDILNALTQAHGHHDVDVFSSRTRNVNWDGVLNRFYGAMPMGGWRYNIIASPLAFYKTSLLKKYFEKAGGRVFNFYAMHLYFSMTGATYVISARDECVKSNPYHEYCIHDSAPTEKSAFFRAVLLDVLPIPPPTLALLMAKPELAQPVVSSSGKALPSFDLYIYRKYLKKIKVIDNLLRFFKIVK